MSILWHTMVARTPVKTVTLHAPPVQRQQQTVSPVKSHTQTWIVGLVRVQITRLSLEELVYVKATMYQSRQVPLTNAMLALVTV